MTDKKTPLTSETSEQKKATVSVSKPITKSATKPEPSKSRIKAEKKTPSAQNNGISKLAIFALVVAILGTSGLFFWQQQQSQVLSQQIQQQNKLQLQQHQQQNEQALLQQKNILKKQFNDVINQINNTSKINDLKNQQIVTLNQAVQQLKASVQQRQPSDWLLHETEYLIRIAARTLWLEHDTKAAIGLLKDADSRLAELNDPTYLPVRELIHQDIKSLELMPKLKTDEIVLALMAMNKQVSILPLALVNLGEDESIDKRIELSADINDWQSNLEKTWQKFLNDFIRVRQRSGVIEPLISAEEQQHLKQNLSLKIQLALWAATERKTEIYQKTLADIQQWFNEFFDMEHPYNQQFVKALSTLQQQRVNVNHPSELSSLVAIRAILTKKTPTLTPAKITAPKVTPKKAPKKSKVQHTDNTKANNESVKKESAKVKQIDEQKQNELIKSNNKGDL